MAARTVRTVCPRNCYCTCGMLVTVDEGRIAGIEGDPKNPATGGKVCLKGLSYARRVTSEDRLLTPLRRTRRGGRLERVSWDEALSDISARLAAVRQESGPEAALYYEGSGSHGALGQLAYAFWHQYGGCTVPYGDLCWPAGLEATRLTYGANLHSHPRLTADSRFVLLWGHNPAETNIHQMRLLLDAQERGGVLALVDPRETDTSDVVDVVVKPKPGTDGALALGMARAIVDEGLHDEAFLAANAVGVDEYLARLRDFPLDKVAAITGVPADGIRALALQYARTRPALIIAGFGLQRHRQAGQTIRAVALLAALTANVGVAGGGWQYANLASHCLKPLPLPPRPARLRHGFPVARLSEALKNLSDPRIRAAWIEKANPVSQSPDSTLVRERLSRLDLVVVVDQFLTDTTGIADYVLPAKSLFEQDDLVTAYWHPYLQRRQKLLNPPGEVKPESEIWRMLCERFGFETSWFPRDPNAMLATLLPDGCGETFERLAHEPLDLSGRGDVAFVDLRFPTPSGKIEFASEEARRLWNVDRVPDYRPVSAGLKPCPTGDGSTSDSGLRPSTTAQGAPTLRPAPGRPEPGRGTSAVEGRTSDYPLVLLSCKTRDRIHSQFGNVDWIREVERHHVLDIHPVDAAARNLRNGCRASVWNDRGRIDNVIVRIVPGLKQGVVHILEGRSHKDDPDVNALTAPDVTDMGYGAVFYDCRVEVGLRPRQEGWGS